LSLLPLVAIGAELDHSFNSPSFSGIGYSSHVLTIQQLETQQKDKNKAAADALKAQEKADAANTPQAQFQANVQSRIYSQLAKQITDTLFGANGGPSCGTTCGGTMDIGGNTITWGLSTDGKTVNIKIVNNFDPSQFTKMSVPVGTFGF
jgi:phosphotransferase system IIB component